MKLCEKLVKLRKESGMTQEELAEKIFVTRTAVSKWENDKGYPGIDSLKLLSRLYGISLDELISEEDVTAVRQAKIKRGRTFYILAVVCLVLTAAFALAAWLSQIPWFLLPSAAGAVGYVVFGFLTKPSLSGMPRGEFIRHVACRIVVLVIVLGVLITTFVQSF